MMNPEDYQFSNAEIDLTIETYLQMFPGAIENRHDAGEALLLAQSLYEKAYSDTKSGKVHIPEYDESLTRELLIEAVMFLSKAAARFGLSSPPSLQKLHEYTQIPKPTLHWMLNRQKVGFWPLVPSSFRLMTEDSELLTPFRRNSDGVLVERRLVRPKGPLPTYLPGPIPPLRFLEEKQDEIARWANYKADTGIRDLASDFLQRLKSWNQTFLQEYLDQVLFPRIRFAVEQFERELKAVTWELPQGWKQVVNALLNPATYWAKLTQSDR